MASGSASDVVAEPSGVPADRDRDAAILILDDADADNSRKRDTGTLFRKHILLQWARGFSTDKACCELAWYATKAGASGVSDLAVSPDVHGRNHRRTIRQALGLDTASKVPTGTPSFVVFSYIFLIYRFYIF